MAASNFDQRAASIVGVGNCGTALAWAIHEAGIQVAELVVHRAATAEQRALAKDCGAKLVKWREWKQTEARVIWICVPDDAIAGVAGEIAKRMGRKENAGFSPFHFATLSVRASARRVGPRLALVEMPPLIFLHASGALSYRVLEPVKKTGAAIGAAHPFRSFPKRERTEMRGTYFAVEGKKVAREAATAMAWKMGCIPFELKTKDKALYHAFGAFGSPLLTALLAAGGELGARAGVPKEIVPRLMASLAGGTFTNWQRAGPAEGFSGPISRGDIETIRMHLTSLAGMPELDAIYRSLSIYAATRLPAKRRAELRKALKAGRE